MAIFSNNKFCLDGCMITEEQLTETLTLNDFQIFAASFPTPFTHRGKLRMWQRSMMWSSMPNFTWVMHS